MRKMSLFLAIVLVAMLAVGAVAMAEVKMGQAQYAAHGTRAFCVATVAMDGDTIVGVILDEYQYVDPAKFTGVPNADNFTITTDNGDRVLASKRLNNDAYSANMMAGETPATQELLTSYQAIEAFATGMTLADLEAVVEGQTKETFEIDTVTGSTLTDTYGYLLSIIEACKAAQ